jgi:hypothetical protein
LISLLKTESSVAKARIRKREGQMATPATGGSQRDLGKVARTLTEMAVGIKVVVVAMQTRAELQVTEIMVVAVMGARIRTGV